MLFKSMRTSAASATKRCEWIFNTRTSPSFLLTRLSFCVYLFCTYHLLYLSVPTTYSTFSVPTSSVPTSNVPTSNVPTSNVPTSNVTTSNVPTSNVTTSNVPTYSVPTYSVPTSYYRFNTLHLSLFLLGSLTTSVFLCDSESFSLVFYVSISVSLYLPTSYGYLSIYYSVSALPLSRLLFGKCSSISLLCLFQYIFP